MILTLNIFGIVGLILLIIVQKLFGRKNPRYTERIHRVFKPEKFFNKFEVIFEDENLAEEKLMFTYTPHCIMSYGT
jgi:hypothetical protein